MNSKSILIVALVATLAAGAQAQQFTMTAAEYPVLVQRHGAVDPNTFIPGPAAALSVRGGHANYPHPALVMRAEPAHVDSNRFIVRHPASQSWMGAPASVAVAPLPAVTLR